MKLRMKRLQAVLLAGILVCSAAGLAGCGKEEAGEVSGKTQSAMEEDGARRLARSRRTACRRPIRWRRPM